LTATTGPDPIALAYDPRGNLVSKSGNANNVHSGASHTVTYTSFNLPNSISRPGGDASQFFYAPDRSRWKQAATYGGTAETTVYVGNLIEKVTVGSTVLWRHYIAGGTGPVAVYTRKSSGTNEIHYLTRDHLGSVDSVTSAAGAVEVRMAFGAFGQRRQESGWSGNLTSADWTGVASTTRRGYTFHETLDNLNLTHMNGRVYDQVTGRFLSPDPFVQAPGFTQSFNRYAYVFNNPLSYTDPSGYNADNADGAADSAAAVASGNPILFLVQLARLWGGGGETVSEQMDRKYREELGNLVPQFDPVQRPRTVNTDAGEPVKNDPAAGFRRARVSTVGETTDIFVAQASGGIPMYVTVPSDIAADVEAGLMDGRRTSLEVASIFAPVPPVVRGIQVFRGWWATRGLISELAALGIRHTPEGIVAIQKIGGRIVFLEKGNGAAGLAHIVERHGADFARRGISESQIPNALMTALSEGRVVGMQRARPIYEFSFNGQTHRIAIDVANNGFIVGANPAGL